MNGGVKYDGGKLPIGLISGTALNILAAVLQFGAKKYAPRNWELGMDWSRVWDAAQRHLWAWWQGESNDPETGLSHLGHAFCCIMFLVHYEATQTGRDDRPKVLTESAQVVGPEERSVHPALRDGEE